MNILVVSPDIPYPMAGFSICNYHIFWKTTYSWEECEKDLLQLVAEMEPSPHER